MTIPASVPRWAVLAAYAVPLCVLPSAAWRSTLAFQSGLTGVERAYVLGLSVVSLGLALLTLGLVHRWGERFPARFVVAAAYTGGVLLVAICLYALMNAAFDVVDRGPVLVGPDEGSRLPPGGEVLALYLPLLAWGPLLLAVAENHRRRRAAA
jgi:hypothetical protein